MKRGYVSSEQPTCQGCALNPNFWTNSYFPLQVYKNIDFLVDKNDVSLRGDELTVLDHLRNAWNAFVSLDAKHPDHNNEFRDAIHKCQYIIGVRVAQRVNPEIWYVPVPSEPQA